MRKVFFLEHDIARQGAIRAIQDAPAGMMVTIQEKTRTLDQNALLWPLLSAVSNQVVWHGTKLSPDQWKDVFSAALKKQTVVPGIDGGFVVCGQRTSRMPKSEFSELLELIYAFGAERGVTFDDERRIKQSESSHEKYQRGY